MIWFIIIINMGNTLHRLRRGSKELRESLSVSDAFSTLQQRKGDRFIKTFLLTFVISMGIVSVMIVRVSIIIKSSTTSRRIISTIDRKSHKNLFDAVSIIISISTSHIRLNNTKGINSL